MTYIVCNTSVYLIIFLVYISPAYIRIQIVYFHTKSIVYYIYNNTYMHDYGNYLMTKYHNLHTNKIWRLFSSVSMIWTLILKQNLYQAHINTKSTDIDDEHTNVSVNIIDIVNKQSETDIETVLNDNKPDRKDGITETSNKADDKPINVDMSRLLMKNYKL